MTLSELKKLTDAKQAYLDKTLKGLQKDIAEMQRKLFDELFTRLVSKLSTENGKLSQSVGNFRAINSLDDLMREFTRQFGNTYIKDIAKKMLETLNYTDDYYRQQLGVSETAFKSMISQSEWVYERIGIDRQGNIIQGGYLSKLAEMPEVQMQVRDYITNNITSGASMSEFQKGFKDLLIGTKDLPGKIMQYNQQFTFDLFNQVDSAINKVYSDSVGLDFAIYTGTIIETSRCFCRKRAGKVFSKLDISKWKEDVTLEKYYKKNPYNPFIDRGGHNCRHDFTYIDRKTAEQMGYNKADANDILTESCD